MKHTGAKTVPNNSNNTTRGNPHHPLAQPTNSYGHTPYPASTVDLTD